MVTKIAAEFTINYRQILDENGKLVDTLPKFAENPSNLVELYKHMVLARVFDAKAIALQRTGKLGTYPSTLGQEAFSTGAASAMQPNDVLCPYYRDNPACFWRGVKLEEVLLYWGGNELGSSYTDPRVKEDFPFCVPISSQNLHAVGVALAFKLRKQQRAVVVIVGDGGTSRGDFYEAINFAGLKKLPIVFIINNNHWAISVPLDKQTATKTLAQKGIAGEVFSEQVDGNDVIVMRQAVAEALQRAHANEGPTVIEALTYRIGDHTTADDATRYRDDTEVAIAKQKDPVVRLRTYLDSIKQWDQTQETQLQREVFETVNQAVERYLATPVQPATSMFDYLYADLPRDLISQRDMVK